MTDDFDGSEAHETVRFALDGIQYEIDLSDKNAKKIREAMKPFVAAARRQTAGRPVRRNAAALPDPELNRAIRQWAVEQGIMVNVRGRIKNEVQEAFKAKDPSIAGVEPAQPETPAVPEQKSRRKVRILA